MKLNFTAGRLRCRWSDAAANGTAGVAAAGNASGAAAGGNVSALPLCAEMLSAAIAVGIDFSQAALTGEHVSSYAAAGGNPATAAVAVFGGRAARPAPYEFDIGRREVLCFQAMSNDTAGSNDCAAGAAAAACPSAFGPTCWCAGRGCTAAPRTARDRAARRGDSRRGGPGRARRRIGVASV